MYLADRALILDMGKIIFDGAAQEVLDNDDLRHGYLAIQNPDADASSPPAAIEIAARPLEAACLSDGKRI